MNEDPKSVTRIQKGGTPLFGGRDVESSSLGTLLFLREKRNTELRR